MTDVDFDDLTVRIFRALEDHYPTRGMKVASGETCECGYWTGQETAGKTRPVGHRGDVLNWHRAEVVRGLLTREPDEHQLDRGFGDCPHCRTFHVVHCHECPADVFRDVAAAEGWRMDHIMGYGCIGLCPKCR
jgi:hypothetical protein